MAKKKGCPVGSIRREDGKCVKPVWTSEGHRYFVGRESRKQFDFHSFSLSNLEQAQKEAKELMMKTGKNYDIFAYIGEMKWKVVK